MHVVMNRLIVEEDDRQRLEEAFRHSGEHMKRLPGFVRFEFLRKQNDRIYIVYTEWEDEKFYQAWVESAHFKQAHAGSNAASKTQSELEMFEVLNT